MATPTKGAEEQRERHWAASPWMARLVRLAIFVLPIVAAWLMVRIVRDSLFRPDNTIGFVVWAVQAIIIASSTSLLVDRFVARFLPLASLLGLSLTFPDQAPSRFGIALRTGTIRKLEAHLADAAEQGLDDNEATAARQAIELVTLLGRHERLTRGHTERVRAYSDLIAEEMGLDLESRRRLAWAALLHDIGKLTVPANILNSEGRPTDEEWEILRGHPAAGEAFVEPLADWLGEWKGATAEHHERWDGGGYPRGLAGTEISLAGRIVAAADAFDVITSKRSYKSAMSPEAARTELVRCSGTQFDPDVVRALLQVSLDERKPRAAFAWLIELFRLDRVVQAIAVAPAAAVVGLAAIGSLIGIGDASADSLPERLAFVASDPTFDDPIASTDIDSASDVVDLSPSQNRPSEMGPAPDPTDSTDSSDSSDSTDGVDAPTPPSSVPAAPTPPDDTGESGESGPSTTIDNSFEIPSISTPLVTTPAVHLPNVTLPGVTLPNVTLPPVTLPTTAPPTTTTTISSTTTTTAATGPKARNDVHVTVLGLSKTIYVLVNDSAGSSAIDTGSLRIVSGPGSGSASVSNGTINFTTPGLIFLGTSLTYEVCDMNGLCDRATVSIVL